MARGWMTRLMLALAALGVSAVATSREAVATDAPPPSQVAQGDAPAGDAPAGGDDDGTALDGVAAEDADDAEADASISESVEEEEDKGWSVGASTGISVGIGSFYSTEEGGKARVRWTMGFDGSYTIPVIDVVVSASTGFSQFLTRGGGSQEPQEFRWSDSDLSLSREIYTIPVADIRISGALSYGIPTSRYSYATGSYGSLSPSLSLGWALGDFSLGYSIAYGYNFYEYTSTTFDPSEVDIIGRDSGTEVVASDAIAEPGVLTEHSLNNSFKAGYKFLEDFSVGLSFGFSDSWSFDNGTISQDDEFVSEFADVGRGHSQGTSGAIRFGYAPIEYLSLSLSLSSAQPWKTADNKGYRFPFFDFEGPQSNYTNLGFSVSGQY